jgi:hypothetical protein
MAAAFNERFSFDSFWRFKYLFIWGSEKYLAHITIFQNLVRILLFWGLAKAMDIVELFHRGHWFILNIPGGNTEGLGGRSSGMAGVWSRNHFPAKRFIVEVRLLKIKSGRREVTVV